jgi:hypothetical protein
LYTQDPGTYISGSADASQNAFHGFISKDGVVTWTPVLPADAARDFKNVITAILKSEQIKASADLSATIENVSKNISARTESVEKLRYSLYVLSILAINGHIKEDKVETLFIKAVEAFSDKSTP